MAAIALAWLRSSAPEGFEKKAVKASLKKLVKDSKALNKFARSNTADQALKEKLIALHDTFHEIMDKCEK